MKISIRCIPSSFMYSRYSIGQRFEGCPYQFLWEMTRSGESYDADIVQTFPSLLAPLSPQTYADKGKGQKSYCTHAIAVEMLDTIDLF